MMKRFLILTLLVTTVSSSVFSQDSLENRAHKIAIFTPLYLDSAFDGMENYRYAKNEFPEFINPGLEFYEGVQLALDSMNQEGIQLEVFIYDTRSSNLSLAGLLAKPELEDVDLIITHCNSNEIRTFAEYGLKRNIPVINTNLPNDGGIRNNPFYVMLNSTLKTQCEGIYRHVQKYYSSNPIIVFRKKGQMEDMIKNIFIEYGKTATPAPLRIKWVDLPDNFTINQLSAYLDSTQETLCIAGSLNDYFGKKLALQLATLNKVYPVKIMGMPTWDAIRDFSKPEYRELEIIYCTPFYNARTDRVSASVVNYFTTKMFARPSDMVMRGYEATWHFAKLLDKYKSDLASNLTRREFNVFREFDIQPVMTDPQNLTLDYFENKKLYFLKWHNGVLQLVY